MIKKVISCILIVSGFNLMSMEEEEVIPLNNLSIKVVEDINPENAPIKQEKHTWCSDSYKDEQCNIKRWDSSFAGGLLASIGGGSKVVYGFIAFMLGDNSCNCTNLWFPTACGDRPECLFYSCQWSNSLCLLGGLTVAGCAWAPWWNKKGLNCRKKKETTLPLNDK